MDVLESNKQVAMNWLQAIASGDAATVKALMTENGIWQLMGTSVLSRPYTRDEVCALSANLVKAVKGSIKLKFLNLTAEADRVAVEMEGYSDLVAGGTYNNVYHILFLMQGGKIRWVHEYADAKIVDALAAKMAAGA